MGADLLISAMAIDVDRTPDFEAGGRAVEAKRSLADIASRDEFPEFDELYELIAVEDGDELSAEEGLAVSRVAAEHDEALALVRATLLGDLEVIELALGGTYLPSDVVIIEIRGARIVLMGGVSYGDEPSEAFATLTRLHAAGGVLEAVGFDVGPEREAQLLAPASEGLDRDPYELRLKAERAVAEDRVPAEVLAALVSNFGGER